MWMCEMKVASFGRWKDALDKFEDYKAMDKVQAAGGVSVAYG
jgi:hypothetical protein